MKELSWGANLQDLMKEYLSEEEFLWWELEQMGLIPTEVEVLPEPCKFLLNHNGYSKWEGVSGKTYLIRDRA